jgi:outer membrane protein assembly factor BamB
VAAGRVFVSDYHKLATGGVERVVCLDEQSGKLLWSYENSQVDYSKFAWNTGPRATPTVDGDLVYVLGAAGDLYCLNVKSGVLSWKINLIAKFGAKMPTWGFAASPLVYGDKLICIVGAQPDARIVALNKLTGEEAWRALAPTSDIAYSSPIIVHAGGVDQLIHWAQGEIASLSPQTGQVYWQQACPGGLGAATPVVADDMLLVSGFFKGSQMLKLSADKPAETVLWQVGGENEINTKGLHALLNTPAIKDGYIYGVCSYGQLRCLNAATGERVWETQAATVEKARWASAFIVRNGDVFFLNNDRGELIIADLTPQGYHELGRAQLIKPTTPGAGARQLGGVNWVIPAYADKHIIIRNDQEILRASLEQ